MTMGTLVRGGLAGVIGTAVMSLVIAGARAVGLLRTPPPKQITANVQQRAPVRHRLPEPVFRASWSAAHLAYGSACGVLYALTRPLLPASPVVAGVGYGIAIWGVSYLGLLPGLGLYPSPKADSTPRVAVMIVAHVVFGVTVAETERRLLNRERGRWSSAASDTRHEGLGEG